MSFNIINFITPDTPVAKTIQHNHLRCISPVRAYILLLLLLLSLPGNYRRATDAYLRQHKLDAADNVITQSLHIGVHSLRAKTKNLGIVDKAWAMPKMYKVAENIMSIISCRQFKMIRPNR